MAAERGGMKAAVCVCLRVMRERWARGTRERGGAITTGGGPAGAAGIGSGVSFQFNNNQKFNILTLYSTTGVERRRTMAEQAVVVNKMFYKENSIVGNQQAVHYNVVAQVKKVQDTVDATLAGLLSGIVWLLEEADCKNSQ